MALIKEKHLITVPVSKDLDTAVRVAATRDAVTIAHYVRQALMAQLRADGIEPSEARS